MAYQSMRHSEHPHDIFLVNETIIFTCNLCNELGVNRHYKCTNPTSRCNFHLHTACADAANPAFQQITPAICGGRHTFVFLVHPINDRRCCVACGRHITGYNYHCDRRNLDLHPGCSREFPAELSVHSLRVRLTERLHGRCHHCDRSSYEGGSQNLNTWAYVSDCGTYQFFAACVRDAGVRVSAQAQAVTGPNESTHGHQARYNQVRGGGPQMLNVVVATVDFFNELVRAFMGFPF